MLAVRDFPPFMRISVAARESGISRSSLYLLAASGRIVVKKMSDKKLLVAGESLKAYIDALPDARPRAAAGSR